MSRTALPVKISSIMDSSAHAPRVRIGIVGLNFGRTIIDELLTGPGKELFEIVAICDLDRDKTATIAQRIKVRPYFKLEELLADQTIPAIGLFTGPVGRAELIRKIIRAGKHVMTTKPFEVDPASALKALEEAQKLGRVVHLNSPSPLPSADLRQIQQWRERFNLGRPVACRMEVWASYREHADGSWYDDPLRCPVAPIFRLGIYAINDLIHLFGDAQHVQVLHSRLFTARPTPDNAQLGILFRNGAIANVFASFCIYDGQHHANSMTLNFEKGTVYRNVGPLPFGQGNAGSRLSVAAAVGTDQSVIEHAETRETSGGYQWDVFHRAILGQQLEPQVTPEQVAAGLKIISAMARAERSGRIENV